MKRLTTAQFDVLDYLTTAESPMTVTEVAAALGIPVATARSRVMSLYRYGCIEQIGVAFSGGATWKPVDQ